MENTIIKLSLKLKTSANINRCNNDLNSVIISKINQLNKTNLATLCKDLNTQPEKLRDYIFDLVCFKQVNYIEEIYILWKGLNKSERKECFNSINLNEWSHLNEDAITFKRFLKAYLHRDQQDYPKIGESFVNTTKHDFIRRIIAECLRKFFKENLFSSIENITNISDYLDNHSILRIVSTRAFETRRKKEVRLKYNKRNTTSLKFNIVIKNEVITIDAQTHRVSM